jgi:hypothetical protein
MGASERVAGFVLHGLRNPEDSEDESPIVFTSRDLPAAALPAPLSGFTVVPWLASVSGWNWSSDPRRVIGSGGMASVLLEDPSAVLGTQLLRSAITSSWDIEATRLEPGATSIRVTGTPGALPTAGTVAWIENEAVKITAVNPRTLGATTSTASATLTISRGECGSWDVLHRLDPLDYDARSDGLEDRLLLDSRPGLGAYTFLCSLYLIRLDQYGGLKSYIRRWGYLQAVPTPRKGRTWELKVADIGDLLAEHQMGNEARQVTLSHAVQVLESVGGAEAGDEGRRFHGIGQGLFDLGVGIADGQQPAPENPPPPVATSAALYLDRLEAERFFREPLHLAGAGLSQAMVEDLAAEIVNGRSDGVTWYVELEAGGKWVYQLTAISYTTVPLPGVSLALGPFVRVGLSFIRGEPGMGYDPAQGWSSRPGAPLTAGQAAPKAALRLRLQKTPMQAFLALAISDGAATASAYDLLPCRIGAALPPEVFNVSSAAGSVLSIDVATKKLAERDQLLSRKFPYQLQISKPVKLGDFLRGDVFLLHSLLPGPLMSGAWCARPWIYPAPASPTAVVTPAEFIPEPGQRLPLLRALRLSSGFDMLTLEPQFVRDVKLAQSRERGAEAPLAIRSWLPGNQIGVSALTGSGALASLVTAWLQVYGGEPVAYEVEVSLDWVEDNGVEFLDFVTWSNDEVLSSSGRGVSGNFIIFGLAFDWKTGIALLRLIPDTFNVSQTTIAEGQIAPTLRPVAVTPVSSLVVDVEVESLGDAAFDATTAHGGIWQELLDLEIPIHVTRPAEHNAEGALERDGWLESYPTITSITVGATTSTLRLTFPAAWERDGFMVSDLVDVGDTFLSLPDRRDSAANAAGDLIEPPELQLVDGEAFAAVARPGSLFRQLTKMGA